MDVLLRRVSIPLLRLSLGLVFIWFGALKIANSTPVADLIRDTVPFLPVDWTVPALGVVEVLIGLTLAAGLWLEIVATLMVGHLGGTFLVLVMAPDVAFRNGNPLLLTTEGEFVVKNLVLIAAGVTVAVWHRQATSRPGADPSASRQPAPEAATIRP